MRQLKQAADTARESCATGLDPAWPAEQVRLYTAAARVGYNVSSARRNNASAAMPAIRAGSRVCSAARWYASRVTSSRVAFGGEFTVVNTEDHDGFVQFSGTP